MTKATLTSETAAAREWLDALDPGDPRVRDGRHLREIMSAREGLAVAEARLRDAVAAARRAGDSWTAIGLALGTSKQNAHRKYG
ncbi:MAG: hypothetical protein KF727_06845 [Microbacteriaceae bacterium]|nr:hypothetical protein [Microbacteriaceae bacterium]